MTPNQLHEICYPIWGKNWRKKLHEATVLHCYPGYSYGHILRFASGEKQISKKTAVVINYAIQKHKKEDALDNLPASKVAVDLPMMRFLLLSSCRYALGRMSSAVGNSCDALTNYWHIITPNHKALIKEEIIDAITIGNAGHDCDIERWKKILHLYQ